MLAEDLIQATWVIFAEFGLPQKMVSDACMNLVTEQFRDFAGT